MSGKFKPNDKVKSCDLIEKGIRFWTKGLCCCCSVTIQSPVIVSAEEMRDGLATPQLVAQRRRRLFEALNGLNDDPLEGCASCALVKEKLYKDVNFDYVGGLGGICEASSFNISHFSACNSRCQYCLYTIENDFVPPQYDNIIEFLEAYRKDGKLLVPNSIDYNGGEPTLLKNFDEILNYFVDNKLGAVTIYSNCIKYSQSLCDALAADKVVLITSLDAGTPSTFAEVHGVDTYKKVMDNIIKYRNSGTKGLIVKYNICNNNRSDDDLYGFVYSMAAIRPDHVFICPEFPYGDMQIPKETVEFGAKLYCALEKYTETQILIQTDVMKGDLKLVQYSDDIRVEIDRLKQSEKYKDEYKLYKITVPRQKNVTCLQKVFSIRNEGKHKVIRVAGLKFSLKRKPRKAR